MIATLLLGIPTACLCLWLIARGMGRRDSTLLTPGLRNSVWADTQPTISVAQVDELAAADARRERR